MAHLTDERNDLSSEERLKLLRENNHLKKQIATFQMNEEAMESKIDKLKADLDGFDMEKYKLMDEINSLKYELDIKETSIDRAHKKVNQLKEHYLLLESKYQKQKEKMQTVLNSEKEFFKAMQEVVDYYYDCLLRYSRFTTKILYKLMMNEGLNIQKELKEEFIAKHCSLKILNANLDIPALKTSKSQVFKNLHQRVAFFSDIDFDKTQSVYDRLLEEVKKHDLKVEVNDSTLLGEPKTIRYDKMRSSAMSSSYEDSSYMLNESIGDANTSQTLFLADLDRSENGSSGLGASTRASNSFVLLADSIDAVKGVVRSRLQANEELDYSQLNKVLSDISELMDFIVSNVDMGQTDRKVLARNRQAAKGKTAFGKSKNYSIEIDNILDDMESRATPEAVRGIVSSRVC